jgi:hypothetical protein
MSLHAYLLHRHQIYEANTSASLRDSGDSTMALGRALNQPHPSTLPVIGALAEPLLTLAGKLDVPPVLNYSKSRATLS